MATIPEILRMKFPGMAWTIINQDFAGFLWLASNPIPRPVYEDLLAMSAEVDALLEAQRIEDRKDATLRNHSSTMLNLFIALASTLHSLRTKLPAQIETSVDWTKLEAAEAKLTEIVNGTS